MELYNKTEQMEYLSVLGLHRHPFPVAPDDEDFYISPRIDEIISDIVHGIEARKGFMILTGDVGLGKTTISRRIIQILEEKQIETSLVLHTSLQDTELLKEINRDFGLEIHSNNRGEFLNQLNEFLLAKNALGQNCAIIIDDAQNLTVRSLELIRMISNIETNREKLVQILLIAQPEFIDRLHSKELRQLNSRIVIHKKVLSLSKDHMKDYIYFKLNAAGNQGRISIKNRAFSIIYRYSKGNFRHINKIMDRCLYAAVVHNTIMITPIIVKSAYSDLTPISFKFWNKIAYTIAFILILFGISTGAYMLSQQPRLIESKDHLDSPPKSVNQFSSQNDHPIQDSTHDRFPQSQIQNDKPLQNSTQDKLSQSIHEFLSIYQLSQYHELFKDAVIKGRFKDLSDDIFTQTGWLLLIFDRLPTTNPNFRFFSYTIKPNNNLSWFLFWKPNLRIHSFYYYYQGDEIKILQRLCAKVGLYAYPFDGIVGKQLMQAVIQFQKKNHLPVSGFPDDKTLFLLSYYAKS